jgi:hypothetical protein
MVDRYVLATFEMYRRVLGTIVPDLDEPPPVAHPERAFQRLALVVESLTGYAVGATTGRLGAAIRRGFDAGTRRAVANAVAIAARSLPPPPRVAPASAFVVDADRRPLVDLLGATLHARLCAAVPTARALVAVVHDAITRTSPARLPQLAQTLALLAADDAGAIAFGDRITAAWTEFHGGAPLRARRPVLEPTHEQVVEAGYLLRVG